MILPPAFAILVGLYVAKTAGFSALPFASNAGAWLLGFFLYKQWKLTQTILNYKEGQSTIAVALIALSLVFPGTGGVHRWIPLGPFAVNVSMALTPFVLFGIAECSQISAFLLSLGLSFVFVLQPDAGQATAFSAATILIFALRKSMLPWLRWGGILAAIFFAFAAWTRPDPLPPVDYVERILHLAYWESWLHLTAALAAVLILCSPFLWALRKEGLANRHYTMAAFIYFAVSFLVTEFGNFPVPVLGAGAGPVLGWFLAMKLLNASV